MNFYYRKIYIIAALKIKKWIIIDIYAKITLAPTIEESEFMLVFVN